MELVMKTYKVLVLGGTGMLGSMLVDYLRKEQDFCVTATARAASMPNEPLQGVEWREFDAESPNNLIDLCSGKDAVINAIGVIKPYIKDDDSQQVQRAIRINALFPHVLAQAAGKVGTKILQIATDCVFSGAKGHYVESDKHDALDVYGKTKSLGEARRRNVTNIRCSIIGPEIKGKLSLLEWFLGQQMHARINGYINHLWNGVTTLHFAKICCAIIREQIELPNLLHLIPADVVSKAQLLRYIARAYKREDIIINDYATPIHCNRSLATEYPDLNARLWLAAGYESIPSISEMIDELALYRYVLTKRAPSWEEKIVSL